MVKVFKKENLLLILLIVFNFTDQLSARRFSREIEDVGTAFQFIVPTIAGTRALYDEKESFKQFLEHFLILNGTVHLMKLLINEKDQILINMNLFHQVILLLHLVGQLLCTLDILSVKQNTFI